MPPHRPDDISEDARFVRLQLDYFFNFAGPEKRKIYLFYFIVFQVHYGSGSTGNHSNL